MKKIFLAIFLVLIFGSYLVTYFILPTHNPAPNKVDLPFLNSQAKVVFENSCADCHTNDTKFLWYHYLPVANVWVVNNIERARAKLNFSNWGSINEHKQKQIIIDALEAIADKDMPPKDYLMMHLKANLDKDKFNILYQSVVSWAKANNDQDFLQELEKESIDFK